MTKDELKQVVDKVHANWNITPLPAQLPTIYRVWWDLLEPFEFATIDTVINKLIREDSWAPRAGTVYKRALTELDPNPAPTPALAWEQYRTLATKLDTGVWEQQTPLHPTLQKTINTIGGYHLHTNSDREHFTQIYTQHLNETP